MHRRGRERRRRGRFYALCGETPFWIPRGGGHATKLEAGSGLVPSHLASHQRGSEGSSPREARRPPPPGESREGSRREGALSSMGKGVFCSQVWAGNRGGGCAGGWSVGPVSRPCWAGRRQEICSLPWPEPVAVFFGGGDGQGQCPPSGKLSQRPALQTDHRRERERDGAVNATFPSVSLPHTGSCPGIALG